MKRLSDPLRRVHVVRGSLARLDERWDSLAGHARWLRPGAWRAATPDGGVWRHADVDLPAALAIPGGRAFFTRRRSLVAGLSRPSTTETIARLRTRRCVIPRSRHPRSSATVAMAVRGSRAQWLAISPDSGEAIRIGQPESFGDDYVALRTRVARHLPSVAFDVEDDGAVLRESFSHGRLLYQLPAEAQVPHVRTLVERHASLTHAERASIGSSCERPTPLRQLTDLEPASLPAGLRALVDDPAVERLLATAPLIPSHGDLHPRNVVIDAAPLAFDFDWIGWYEFWIDPVNLLAWLASSLGARRLETDPALTSALHALWESAGLVPEQRPRLHQLIALHVPVLAWRRLTDHGHHPLDREEFSRSVAERWAKVERSLDVEVRA